jgi:hypothetical protein
MPSDAGAENKRTYNPLRIVTTQYGGSVQMHVTDKGGIPPLGRRLRLRMIVAVVMSINLVESTTD